MRSQLTDDEVRETLIAILLRLRPDTDPKQIALEVEDVIVRRKEGDKP